MRIEERNGAIDICRFIYCLIIVGFHFYEETYEHFAMGYTGVEFFAIVSGLFFFRGWEKNKTIQKVPHSYTRAYMKKRFFKFFPYTTAAFLLLAVLRLFYAITSGMFSMVTFGHWAATDIWEILLVKMGGLNNGQNLLNGPAWYISAMLIVEFLVLNLLARWENEFKHFILPLSILIGYGYWRNYTVPGPAPGTWIGFTTFGVLRIYLATCVSYYVFLFTESLRKRNWTNYGRSMLTALEITSQLAAFAIILWGWSRDYIWVLILLFSVSIAITCSGKSYSVKLFKQSRITNYLGRLSLSIFLVQAAAIRVFAMNYRDVYIRYSHKWEFLLTVFILAVLLDFIVPVLTRKLTAIKNVVMKRCIAG